MEDLSDRAQDSVAGLVAMGVVHVLEVVQIEEDERERVADAVRAAPLEHELLVEHPAVGEAGEAVGRGLRGHSPEVAHQAHDRTGEEERD